MKKKLISAVLAGACAVSAMTISSYAVDDELDIETEPDTEAGSDIESGPEINPLPGGFPNIVFPDFNGNVSVSGDGGIMTLAASAGVITATITVTVPSSITAVINPYNVDVKDKSNVTHNADGVTSPLYTIINKSKSNRVEVTAKATLTVPTERIPGSAKATRPTISVETSKDNVKTDNTHSLYAEVAFSGSSASTPIVAAGSSGNVNASSTGVIDTTKLTPLLDMSRNVTGQTAVGKLPFTDMTSVKNDSGVSSTVGVQPDYTSVVVIDCPDEGEFTYAQFQLTGAVNTNAKWTSKNKVAVTLILKIDPTGSPATRAIPPSD